ncbi:hypothetical protein IU449_26895 [Nocardia higoensis]|uniref:Uncharacterized protein n=1 Tax=Nocardia higoensis TaxID=228599 RepID=A0ABS0DJN2_9NOCA|nr:hypothetical protein [Nocardia higoensis]MBF6358128.1 hypothetical protein [Nocardia higoensis]
MDHHLLPVTHRACGGEGCRDCQHEGETWERISVRDLRADETNAAIRHLLGTYDYRVIGRTAPDRMFGDSCDECGAPSLVLTETVRFLTRGAEREGHQHCLSCASDAITTLAGDTWDEIDVTVPARVLPASDYAA